jgi:dihydrofolate reductase
VSSRALGEEAGESVDLGGRRTPHVIEGDVEAAVRELKAKPGRELQVHGGGALLRWRLVRDLVDELNLRLYPVVVGDGLRLFPEQGQTHDLTLVESRSTPSGVTSRPIDRPAARPSRPPAEDIVEPLSSYA